MVELISPNPDLTLVNCSTVGLTDLIFLDDDKRNGHRLCPHKLCGYNSCTDADRSCSWRRHNSDSNILYSIAGGVSHSQNDCLARELDTRMKMPPHHEPHSSIGCPTRTCLYIANLTLHGSHLVTNQRLTWCSWMDKLNEILPKQKDLTKEIYFLSDRLWIKLAICLK